jgi:hypothetical protein
LWSCVPEAGKCLRDGRSPREKGPGSSQFKATFPTGDHKENKTH